MASTLSTAEATRLAPAAPGRQGTAEATGPVPVLVLLVPGRSSTSSSSSSRPFSSFYFSFTRWDLFTSTWIGLKNYQTFFARAGADHRPAQHPDLRRDDLRAQGGPRAWLLAVLLTSQIIARGLPPVGHLLPGPGQHDRRRPDLQGVDEPRAGSDQQRARRWSASTGPGWLTNPTWRCSRSLWSMSGRASGWPP